MLTLRNGLPVCNGYQTYSLISLQALIRSSIFHAAFAGLVEGRHTAFIPVAGSRSLQYRE